MVYRKPLRSAKSNPNAEFMGFELLDKYNDEHPDELHAEWLKKNPRERARGRPRGEPATCSRCGYIGHYKTTCTAKVDYLGNKIKD